MSVSEDAGFEPLGGEPDPFASEVPRPPNSITWGVPLEFVGHKSERELSLRVLTRLAPWFHIEEQVPGEHCSGKSLRIDAIIRPRRAELWRNPDVALGLEFKAFNAGGDISTHEVTGLAAQAIDYTHVTWRNYGRVPVFTCPGALQWFGGARSVERHDRGAQMYQHLLGQLGVGELVLYWGKGLTLQLNSHSIWSERGGIERGKQWGLSVRTGAR
ncbi:hypothetical protein ADL32_18935 [Streptomyces albidoflavus]|uniref:hypothetical protein n=1 Tax=Streptomyces albidoflavus TaxID=1886 RepID=UPI000743E305|nr:hypothetical protein [Streptomyces albidoflavus]KUL59647.1 hypothetical protein ADL32_18935 [Streptomyces albidoflavus]